MFFFFFTILFIVIFAAIPEGYYTLLNGKQFAKKITQNKKILFSVWLFKLK